jgi:pimeloyl-ACP methyl ester carboxylesterase
MKLKHKVITLPDGFRVGVSEVGEGTPLVFLHGLSVSALAYEELLIELAHRGYRVIGIDAPNHGRSGSLPWGHTIEDMALVIGEAAGELDIEQAVWVGHSMGGGLVVELATMSPEAVKAVVLLDAAAGAEHHAGIRVGRHPRIVITAVQKLAGAVIDVVGDGYRAAEIRSLREGLRLIKTLRASVTGFRFVRAAYALMLADTVPLLPLLDRFNVPTAIIHGELDQIVPLAAAISAADLADADLYTIDGAFHSWMVSDPDLGGELIALAIEELVA